MNEFTSARTRAAVPESMKTGTCYERVEMADGVIRLCLCTYAYQNGELRITGIVHVV